MERYVIHVTKECNLNCLYCYEDDKKSIYKFEDIQKLLDNIINYSPVKNISIEFLGGEPMLAWDNIIKSYEYLENNKNIDISEYIITTNGTIFNKNQIEYIKNNKKIRISISLDGHITANQFRIFKKTNINSYKTVIKNIEKLQQNDIDFSIHMVTHPYNIGYLSDSIDVLYKKGITNIDIGTIEKTITIDQKYCDRFIEELNKISLRICNNEYPNLKIGLFEWIKPYEDVRTYIKDENNITIGESYGRNSNDITEQNIYKIIKCNNKDKIYDKIYNIRKTVYNNHQKNKNKITCENDLTIAFSGHNIKNWLSISIESFLNFYPQLKNNIIVFDDDSNDSTKEYLKNNNIKNITWDEQYNSDTLKDKIVCYRVNLIIKQIIDNIKTKYLLLLDGDILIHDKFLECLLPKMEINDIIGVNDLCGREGNITKNIQKYEKIYNPDQKKYRRFSTYFMLLNVEKLKNRNILFDDINNDEYNLNLDSTFDSGVDFYYNTLDKNLNFMTLNIDDMEDFIIHFHGKSVNERGKEWNKKYYQYTSKKQNINPKIKNKLYDIIKDNENINFLNLYLNN